MLEFSAQRPFAPASDKIAMTVPDYDDSPPELRRRAMRAEAIERRKALAPATVSAWSAAICDRLQARWPTPPGRVIGFCWPVSQEPDLRPLVLRWMAQGATPVLPVVIAADAPLRFRPWIPETAESGGGAMVADRFGIPTPVDGPELAPDVLLLPLNAFDAAGYRIGYGGGFFDRTLAALSAEGRRPLAIGVGFEVGCVDTTLPQAHDERLDWIVTEARTLGRETFTK
jgi:5,10-methenyltetrahydrofolate synthetase